MSDTLEARSEVRSWGEDETSQDVALWMIAFNLAAIADILDYLHEKNK